MPELFYSCALEKATRDDWVELTWTDTESGHPTCPEHEGREIGDYQQNYKADEGLARSIVDARRNFVRDIRWSGRDRGCVRPGAEEKNY